MGANRVRGKFGVARVCREVREESPPGAGRRTGAVPVPIGAILRYMVADAGTGMRSEDLVNAPLNVLVILADAGLDVAPVLPALQTHCALVCTSPADGVAAARSFAPDVVLVDLRVPDPLALVGDVARAAGGRPLVFAALAVAAGPAPAPPPGYRYCLALPATAGELERLLGQARRDLAAARPGPAAVPDGGPIG